MNLIFIKNDLYKVNTMLEISKIRDNKEQIITALLKRGKNYEEDINELLYIDELRRKNQKINDDLKSEKNKFSKEIGEFYKSGKREEADMLKTKSLKIDNDIKVLEEKEIEFKEKIDSILKNIPNTPHSSVPEGKTPEDNVIVYVVENIDEISVDALPHWDLCEKYNIIDFQLGVKITGAGFPVYLGKGAKLQRALINFFLDEANNSGYNEVIPPFVVNSDSGFGTGQLPDKEGQMYHIGIEDFYLIPTAEVPVTNIFRNVILNEKDFPIKYCAYSPCFRREAGSYGKDVRGLNRLHQFEKVEIVQVAKPNESYEILGQMKNHVENLLKKLELPYRILDLCGGDMGFSSAHTYDFEVFSKAQKKWLEVSSVSNFESFQSNRLKLRYKDNDGNIELAHTLNGSALALPRILASILENYQKENSITIPKVLVKYCGFEEITL